MKCNSPGQTSTIPCNSASQPGIVCHLIWQVMQRFGFGPFCQLLIFVLFWDFIFFFFFSLNAYLKFFPSLDGKTVWMSLDIQKKKKTAFGLTLKTHCRCLAWDIFLITIFSMEITILFFFPNPFEQILSVCSQCRPNHAGNLCCSIPHLISEWGLALFSLSR